MGCFRVHGTPSCFGRRGALSNRGPPSINSGERNNPNRNDRHSESCQTGKTAETVGVPRSSDSSCEKNEARWTVSENVPQLLTLIEVSERLRVSTHTIRNWVRKGRLRPVRLCRRLTFDPAEISRLVAENSSTNPRAADSGSTVGLERTS
jgi:excisionase family DNA binding protein